MANRNTAGTHWAPGSSASPLAWWTRAQLDAVATHIRGAWTKCARDWMAAPRPMDAGFGCGPVHEAPQRAGARWELLGHRGAASAWLDTDGDITQRIQDLLFGPDHAPAQPAPGVARAVAVRATEALQESLRICLHIDAPGHASPGAPEAHEFKPWSGSLILSLPGARGASIVLLLNGACARILLPAAAAAAAVPPSDEGRPKLVELRDALAGRSLTLRVELSPCELDLGSLQTLRVGDIIPLPHPLEEPLRVSTAAGSPFCAGFLGRRGGSKALELVREHAPPEQNPPFQPDKA